MRSAVLLAAVVVVAGCSLSASPNAGKYDALKKQIKVDDNLKLVFASPLWRHGDRSPTEALPGVDRVGVDDWKFGGGGYGQLSPIGMKQHFNLGKKLRQRYVYYPFLSDTYDARQIYVRATDVNRTLVSAYSNLIGMYSSGKNANRKDRDLPSVPGWPEGLVPIPVHTVYNPTDHVGNPAATCKRLSELYEGIYSSHEYQKHFNDPKRVELLEYLSNSTGTNITAANIWQIVDAIVVESIHFKENVTEWYPWFFERDIQTLSNDINNDCLVFEEGMGNVDDVRGVDVSVEVPRLKAGATLQAIRQHAAGVLDCYRNIHWGEKNITCDSAFQKLKYFVLSAHDTTVDAYLSVLGAKDLVPGLPHYSAAILTEFYADDATKEFYIQFWYHASEDDDFRNITPHVRGCSILEDKCPLTHFLAMADKYDPGNIEQLCATPVKEWAV